MMRFIEWIRDRFGEPEEPVRPKPLWQSGAHVPPRPRNRKTTPARPRPTVKQDVEFSTGVGGRIADGGPGKNVLIRNKYVREDTGTHETLKIVDESLLEPDEESGADPYNTGRFDRSKSWDSFRNRK